MKRFFEDDPEEEPVTFDVERLLSSVREWNRWREEDLQTSPYLAGANLRYAHLTGANLGFTDLSEADLSRSFCEGANFMGANLSEAQLGGAYIKWTDLSDVDLSGADLSDTDMNWVYLNSDGLNWWNDLSRGHLRGADLTEAIPSGANFSKAIFGRTSIGDYDLRMAKGLETVKHLAPSQLSINTLYLSGGDIPEPFLKGTGAPDSFIVYARSLTQQPIEYYTCFISYSSKDELFARRLHNDLQQEGVRCWFAPEDLKIGDKFRHRIDESIRMYDKLLLVLSEASLASTWVSYEVEKALNKEPDGVPNVLFPIRLDKAILTCETDWAKDIRKSRHIGDFEHWKDHDAYQIAFERLLRDLKAQS